MSEQILAERFFDALGAYTALEIQIEEAILTALGIVYEGKTTEEIRAIRWPFKRITYDDYDYSFELKDTRDDWQPTEEQQKALFAIGFCRFWVCYIDGGERYYPGGSYRPSQKAAVARTVASEDVVCGRVEDMPNGAR
jgi:hypothetical protein